MKNILSNFEENNSLTLFEFMKELKKTINHKVNYGQYWVSGKLHNWRKVADNYFGELVAYNNKDIISRIDVNLSSSNSKSVISKFFNATESTITSGLDILFLVRLNFHDNFDISLAILDVDPSFTLNSHKTYQNNNDEDDDIQFERMINNIINANSHSKNPNEEKLSKHFNDIEKEVNHAVLKRPIQKVSSSNNIGSFMLFTSLLQTYYSSNINVIQDKIVLNKNYKKMNLKNKKYSHKKLINSRLNYSKKVKLKPVNKFDLSPRKLTVSYCDGTTLTHIVKNTRKETCY